MKNRESDQDRNNVPGSPLFFRDAAALRAWFATHAATEDELIVGYMKKATGVRSVTWPESVDEALCVGWIDGVRWRLDDERYAIRFTPRRPRSAWSNVNIARAQALQAEGRMQPAGLAAYAKRTEGALNRASYEQKATPELGAAERKRFKAERAAWAYYEKLPPSYRRAVTWWVISAKKPETRTRRFERLVEACAAQRRLSG